MNPDAQLSAPAWRLQAPKLSHILLRPLSSQKIGAPRRANLPAQADARKTIRPGALSAKNVRTTFNDVNSLGKQRNQDGGSFAIRMKIDQAL
jgi:hypothetical protein